jgi:hypothetical protein
MSESNGDAKLAELERQYVEFRKTAMREMSTLMARDPVRAMRQTWDNIHKLSGPVAKRLALVNHG